MEVAVRTLFVLAGFVAALASTRTVEAQDKNNPAPIPGWHPDLDAGFAEAKQTGKPMFVVFR